MFWSCEGWLNSGKEYDLLSQHVYRFSHLPVFFFFLLRNVDTGDHLKKQCNQKCITRLRVYWATFMRSGLLVWNTVRLKESVLKTCSRHGRYLFRQSLAAGLLSPGPGCLPSCGLSRWPWPKTP
jgi:hypothetical protein